MKKYFLLIFFLFFTFAVFAQEAVVTLDEAVFLALRDNKAILMKQEDILKAQAAIRAAQAPLFPSLTASNAWARTSGYYTDEVNQFSGQLSLKQVLFAGGAVVNTIRFNEKGVQISQAMLDSQKLDLILNVRRYFLTALLARDYLDLNKRIVANTRSHLRVYETRYKTGETSKTDLLHIQDSLTIVEKACTESANQYEAALTVLKSLLAFAQDSQMVIKGELDYNERNLAYEEGYIKALSKRPEIRQYELTVAAARDKVEIAKAGNRPSIYAAWDYYGRSHTSGLTAPVKNNNDYNVAGLYLSWPIFDGWETKAKIDAALEDVKSSQLAKEQAVINIAVELKIAYLDFKDAVVKLRAARSSVGLYKDNLRMVKEKYSAGMLSLLDLDDASVSYNVALFKEKQAIYDYTVAQARFDKATGG